MISRRLLLPVLMIAAIATSWTSASATTISLSNVSDDPTIDASLLDATLQFDLTAPSTLTLTVTNYATNFDVIAVFFNAPASVTGLSLSSGPKKWMLENRGRAVQAGGFGTFDYVAWLTRKDVEKEKLKPGESGVFVFNISGAGPFAATDFTTSLSDARAGQLQANNAANSLQGNNVVAGAIHAPEPGSRLLLGLGLIGLAVTSRKRSSRIAH